MDKITVIKNCLNLSDRFNFNYLRFCWQVTEIDKLKRSNNMGWKYSYLKKKNEIRKQNLVDIYKSLKNTFVISMVI